MCAVWRLVHEFIMRKKTLVHFVDLFLFFTIVRSGFSSNQYHFMTKIFFPCKFSAWCHTHVPASVSITFALFKFERGSGRQLCRLIIEEGATKSVISRLVVNS